MSQTLIDALHDPALYNHPVTRVELIETHISWVLLAGDYAYKIKKPVDFGFLDFSTLEKREHYCREELRLNRRLAASIYLDVISIGGPAETPSLGATGNIIEYAVKMCRFDEALRLDHLLARNELGSNHIDSLADELATFHQSADVAGADSEFGGPDAVLQPILENFNQIRPLLDPRQREAELRLLGRIEQWCQQSFNQLRDTLADRKQQGFIRECHGDAHLANMVLIEDKVVLFDCLEFNPALRWIDVISELAFVVMDLDDRGHPELARRLLDRYLQRSGDYAAVALLRFYQVYRACVRAKVAALRWQQAPVGEDQQSAWREFCDYLSLAESYTHSQQPVVVCCHGVSGSGKTTISQRLLESLPLIRLRSDVERKRLFELPLEARSDEAVGAAMYSKETNARTFDQLASLTQAIVEAGFGVIVDATFLRQAERQRFAELARVLNAPFRILEITATEAVMRERIEQRNHLGTDASEADVPVLARQLEWREPLTPAERKFTLTVVNNDGVDLAEVGAELVDLIKGKD